MVRDCKTHQAKRLKVSYRAIKAKVKPGLYQEFLLILSAHPSHCHARPRTVPLGKLLRIDIKLLEALMCLPELEFFSFPYITWFVPP